MFLKRGATGEMFEEAHLEEAAVEMTRKILEGKQEDVSNQKIHWSPAIALGIEQSAFETMPKLIRVLRST